MSEKEEIRKEWNEYQRLIYWNKRFGAICPLAEPDNRDPPEYNTIQEAIDETNTAKKCKAYSKETECECHMTSNPGRCDCWKVYWNCSLFRQWRGEQQMLKKEKKAGRED